MKTIPTTLSRKQWFLLTVLALHFSCIMFKVFRTYPFFKEVLNHFPTVKVISESYTQLAVLQADYCFFSPNIGADYDVVVDVEDTKGKRYDASYTFPNKEVEMRFGSCVLAMQDLQDSLQDIVVKSWAARTYNKYPTAHQIKVRVESSKMPPMSEFKAGKRRLPEKLLEIVFQTNQPISELNTTHIDQ